MFAKYGLLRWLSYAGRQPFRLRYLLGPIPAVGPLFSSVRNKLLILLVEGSSRFDGLSRVDIGDREAARP
ncbi:MAG: hypothetical protein ACFB00_05330 [Parvularculaceae bacterium]